MGPERLIQEALEHAGDPAGAFLWRRVCRDLDGDLRVGVCGRDDGTVGRAIRALSDGLERVEWVALRLEGQGEALAPTLGAVDRLLGVHALLWATPATAPLGAEERAGMTAMVDAGGPSRRAVVLADTGLLAQMSDDPAGEAREVLERARALVGRDWRVLVGDEARRWLEEARAERVELAADRRRTVAALLLRDALQRSADAIAVAAAEVARVDELLAAEDQALEAERKRGRRTAAHLLGAMRRQTEQMLVDLRAFLVALEGDLAAQVEAVDDLDVVRRTISHWLAHVVEQWMGGRLASWRAAVLADLAELGLEDGDLDRAELLVPALHPAPVKSEAGWGQRIGITAAVGSGAAMLVFGFWLPGLLALTGGLAWSALGRRAAEASTRRALIEAATDAVRQMSQDAERLLRDQIAALEDELGHLGDERATELGRTRATQRGGLEQERALRRQRLASLEQVRGDLERRIALIQGRDVALGGQGA